MSPLAARLACCMVWLVMAATPGCSGPREPDAGDGLQARASESAAGSSRVAEERVSAGALQAIRLRVVGGFAGFDLDLEITGDDVQLRERGSLVNQETLTPPDRQRLEGLIAAIDPEQVEGVYGAPDPRMADGMSTWVDVTGSERSWQTQMTDGGAPPANLLALVEDLMSRAMRLSAGAAR